MLIGVVADDMTGASDVALMLARGGLTTVQTIGVPQGDLPSAEAVVVALKSRTAPVEDAVAQSVAAARALRAAGAQRLLFKYCSTFDSTPQGNIGPVADALMDEVGADIALVCPAFPAAGRTIYQGYLFVNGEPLNESAMRDHPLTPMRDASLRRLMAAQSAHRVGLLALATIRKGAQAARTAIAALKQEGFRYAVADAIDDEDCAFWPPPFTISRSSPAARASPLGCRRCCGRGRCTPPRRLTCPPARQQSSPAAAQR